MINIDKLFVADWLRLQSDVHQPHLQPHLPYLTVCVLLFSSPGGCECWRDNPSHEQPSIRKEMQLKSIRPGPTETRTALNEKSKLLVCFINRLLACVSPFHCCCINKIHVIFMSARYWLKHTRIFSITGDLKSHGVFVFVTDSFGHVLSQTRNIPNMIQPRTFTIKSTKFYTHR